MNVVAIQLAFALSDQDMIRLLGISKITWTRWTSGHTPCGGLAIAVLQALEAASGYLTPAECVAAGCRLRLGLGAFIYHGLLGFADGR